MCIETILTVDERSSLLEAQQALQQHQEEFQPTKKYDATTLPVTISSFNNNNREDSERSLLSRGWTEYNDRLTKSPLCVKSATAFLLLGLADAVAQACQHFMRTTTSDHWDWIRSLRFAVFGLVGAPWTHYYFDVLDYMLPPTPDNPCSWITFLKLFIDQFIQAPILLGLIIIVLNAMEGQDFTSILHDLQDHYWTTLVTNWKLWLPASFVNLAFVKPSLRVLFENAVFFVWTIMLSVILHSD